MRGHVFLPFIAAIARDAEFTGNLGSGPLAALSNYTTCHLTSGVNRCRWPMSHLLGGYRASI
jgi:hypothetical protein